MRFILFPIMLSAIFAFAAQPYSWQLPHSTVSEKGDLILKQEPFVFKTAGTVKYIDFDGGNDANTGDNIAQAWKYHPWDPSATDNAKLYKTSNSTFIFKCGVTYRGSLKTSKIDNVTLTSDTKWGIGEAIISGTEIAKEWKQGADKRFPNAEKVWYTDLQFAPRRVWIQPAKENKMQRLKLARTPNWKPGKDDYMAEWYNWEQPEWWTNKNKIKVGNNNCHLGIDTKNLTGDAEQYKDAIVWSEYGIMMGSPFASKVETYDANKKAIAFQGPWYGDSEKIITGNRYFLEDKPQFLDEAGEFWFDKKDAGGRLYLRMPDDSDPNLAIIEAAKYSTLLDTTDFNNFTISGLSFNGGNIFWDYTVRPFINKDLESVAININGSGDNLNIINCKFANITGGIAIKADKDSDKIKTINICDNNFTNLDRTGINISDSNRWAKSDPPFSTIQQVNILRNYLSDIGLRGGRDCHGHTIQVSFAECIEIGGNKIEKVGGSGIFIFGGKGSGEKREKSLSRIIIHHNKVVDPLMISNDWGGIETWQGGPHYVYNNISKNPGGYWNWAYKNTKAADATWGSARQGFAYYFDGSFKNYVFNNLAIGNNNTLGSPLCNAAAFQECIGFQNSFFNNTATKFATGHRRQAARAGRDKYLGNIYDDMSDWNFLQAEPKNAAKDANAYQFNDIKGTNYKTELNAYSKNVFTGTPRDFGTFEEDGTRYKNLADFASAQKRNQAMAQDVGIFSEKPVLTDTINGDYRPIAGTPVEGSGAKLFVPWSLYECVGEYNFTPDMRNPNLLIDEHWFMKTNMVGREDYWKSPTFPLNGVNVKIDNFVNGKLENWTKGALQLNGTDQYLTLKNVAIPKITEYEMVDNTKEPWITVTLPKEAMPDKSFIIKVSLNAELPAGSTLAADLHCLKGANWGGFLAVLGRTKIDGKGPYTFKVTPPDGAGITKYIVTIFASPTGGWNDATNKASIEIPKIDAPELFNPAITTSNFLIETIIKTGKDANGLIIEKKDTAGYSVSINRTGNINFSIASADGGCSVTGKQIINDGSWHHVIVETDRKAGRMTIYVDGKKDAEETGKLITGSLESSSDLFIAGTPQGKNLLSTLEFLRICRGNLADARTTIDELYTWEFAGPQFTDFTGVVIPDNKRSAGAISLK